MDENWGIFGQKFTKKRHMHLFFRKFDDISSKKIADFTPDFVSGAHPMTLNCASLRATINGP